MVVWGWGVQVVTQCNYIKTTMLQFSDKHYQWCETEPEVTTEEPPCCRKETGRAVSRSRCQPAQHQSTLHHASRARVVPPLLCSHSRASANRSISCARLMNASFFRRAESSDSCGVMTLATGRRWSTSDEMASSVRDSGRETETDSVGERGRYNKAILMHTLTDCLEDLGLVRGCQHFHPVPCKNNSRAPVFKITFFITPSLCQASETDVKPERQDNPFHCCACMKKHILGSKWKIWNPLAFSIRKDCHQNAQYWK